jgi:hypothetical protein
MSLKYATQKVSDNHYVLPKVGEAVLINPGP